MASPGSPANPNHFPGLLRPSHPQQSDDAARQRIVFVDDEPRILRSMQRLLRGHRGRWDMRFFTEAREAQADLRKEPAHVVVTDMRMPDIDGAELLEWVAKEVPNAIRITLTGYADTERLDLSSAHQHVSKPCAPTALIRIIERAVELRDFFSSKDEPHKPSCIPAAPPAFSQFRRVTRHPSCTALDAASVILESPGLAERFLTVVNASCAASGRQVASVVHAIEQLGLVAARNYLLAAEVFEPQFFAGASEREVIEARRHAFMVGTIARAIVDQMTSRPHAFAAGVLHDLGKLFIAARHPEQLERARFAAQTQEVLLHVAEEHLFRRTHAEIGAYVVGAWGLPYPVVEGIAHHHYPDVVRPREIDVAVAVHVAEAVANERTRGQLHLSAEEIIDPTVANLAGIDQRLEEARRLKLTFAGTYAD